MIPIVERWTAIPGRRDEPEWLDQGLASPQEVRECLADLERINRWLGGRGALRRELLPRIETAAKQGPVRTLEAGCGSASISAWLGRWAQRRSIALETVGLDLARMHLAAGGRSSGAALVQGDALVPPFIAGSFDYCFSTLLMHHFTPPRLVALLRAMSSLARRAVVMNDLVRDRIPEWFFRGAGPLLARSRVTRHDGLVSIRRAYTPAELKTMLAEAGIAARVSTHWPAYRMTAVIERGDGAG